MGSNGPIKSLDHVELGSSSVGGGTMLGFDFGWNRISKCSDITASTAATTTTTAAKATAGQETSSSKTWVSERQIARSSRGRYIGQETKNVVEDTTLTVGEQRRMFHEQRKRSCVPEWFPYTPTRRQIERLKVMELRDACHQRGLARVRKDAVGKWMDGVME